MPVPMRPFVLRCLACRWRRTVVPRSDVLFPSDWVEQCPRCGSRQIERHPAGEIDVLAARFKQWLMPRL